MLLIFRIECVYLYKQQVRNEIALFRITGGSTMVVKYFSWKGTYTKITKSNFPFSAATEGGMDHLLLKLVKTLKTHT